MLLTQTAFNSVVGEDLHQFPHDLSKQVLALSPLDSAASMETDRFKFACIIENSSRCCPALKPDEDLTKMPDFFCLSHLVSSLSRSLVHSYILRAWCRHLDRKMWATESDARRNGSYRIMRSDSWALRGKLFTHRCGACTSNTCTYNMLNGWVSGNLSCFCQVVMHILLFVSHRLTPW